MASSDNFTLCMEEVLLLITQFENAESLAVTFVVSLGRCGTRLRMRSALGFMFIAIDVTGNMIETHPRPRF